MVRPGRDVGRVALDAEQKPGAHERARHRGTNTGIEIAAVAALAFVKRERRLNIVRGHGATERAPGQRREDLLGARGLFSRAGRSTNEQAVARRGIADARDVVRAFDYAVLEPRHP